MDTIISVGAEKTFDRYIITVSKRWASTAARLTICPNVKFLLAPFEMVMTLMDCSHRYKTNKILWKNVTEELTFFINKRY